MQNEVKRSNRPRIARILCDEWAMIALLAAGLFQSGLAIHAMNGVVRSNGQVLNGSELSEPVTMVPAKPLAVASKDALALARPSNEKNEHQDF